MPLQAAQKGNMRVTMINAIMNEKAEDKKNGKQYPSLQYIGRVYFAVVFLFCCLFAGVGAGLAQQPSGGAKTAKAFELISLRVMGDLKRVRVVAVYNAKPELSLRFLNKPPRLVIDLPKTVFSLPSNLATAHGLVDNIRYGGAGPEKSRIIFGIKKFFQIENVSVEELENDLWQEVFDIVAVPESVFNKELNDQLERQRQKGQKEKKTPQRRPFRVMIDAGHGGIDSGAKGGSGILEKNVTLTFARSLRDALQKYPDIQVFLTRDSDVFLRLGERVAKARELNANLFVSIHTDSISFASLRGATVYTISDKASDNVAKSLAESENKADLLDGLPADDSPAIADILLDLAQRETHTFSVVFADRVVASFKTNEINLIKNPHRYAGFQVLKAPDIPSVLVEIGYLSNVNDEKLIIDDKWRMKVAETLAKTINDFALMLKPTVRNVQTP